ncbi:MAG: RNA polymerase sigma factor [Oscillospiraceae bacterium]|jgi:RNA polymerase sigma-70 factor (ECF subfamily)|nr:RNA polymerase sigma factor [Oscillospiraceae bacterium]
MTHEEEMVIIAKVLAGEHNAYEQLVLAHQDKIYGLALKLLHNAQDAEDIAQEVFVKAFTGLQAYRGEARFSVWLYRMTYNMCIDRTRRAKRAPLQMPHAEEVEFDIKDPSLTPEELLLQRETRDAIERGLQTLPQNQREILILREVTGMSYADIAATLGIGEGTVKSRISRARDALVEYLKRDGTISRAKRHKRGKGE